MMVTRRALLGGSSLLLALPLAFRAEGMTQALTQDARMRISGIGEVWGMSFWSDDAGEPVAGIRPARYSARRAIPAWHPEFA